MQIRRGVYSRAAFISLSASNCAALIRGRRLFEGGVYSRKYGITLQELILGGGGGGGGGGPGGLLNFEPTLAVWWLHVDKP